MTWIPLKKPNIFLRSLSNISLDKVNRITCINKEDRPNPWERIIKVWWVNSQWNAWRRKQEEVIKYINSWEYRFYVNVKWDKVDVIVSKSRFWNEYIKTENDWDEPNNLLLLPECGKWISIPLNKKFNIFDSILQKNKI